MKIDEPQKIYLAQIEGALERITFSEEKLEVYSETGNKVELDSAILQLRKAMESIAYAAIVPNRRAYEQFRKNAEKSRDYRNDYNARHITSLLENVNKDFYPMALLPAERKNNGNLFFDRKPNGFVSKKRFQKIYDRLGKFLHADNPWGKDKGFHNLTLELPSFHKQLRELLSLYATFIITPEFKGVWIIEIDTYSKKPHLIEAIADGEFFVNA